MKKILIRQMDYIQTAPKISRQALAESLIHVSISGLNCRAEWNKDAAAQFSSVRELTMYQAGKRADSPER